MHTRTPELQHSSIDRPLRVERFRKKHFFLSNMFPVMSGIETPVGRVRTTEHAYQLSKFHDEFAQLHVAIAGDGIASKRRARELEAEGWVIRPDWDEIKFGVMLGYNYQKFSTNPELARLLIATGSRELVEGNTWDDTYWGVSPPHTNNGQNNLGKILMMVRDDLISAQ